MLSSGSWIALLGGIGALLRFHFDAAIQTRFGGEFPLGTLGVNLAGSFALGLLTGFGVVGDALLLAGTATLGSFTTFSTWMLETERLSEEGEARVAGADIVISFGAGLLVATLNGDLLSDALLDLFERHELHAAVLMRAVEGFGIKHRLRTDRFLTLSEDLPLVAVAVDERARIETLLPRVTELVGGGLVTLERARLLHEGLDAVELPEELYEATKLTVYLGRDERIGSRPAFLEVVDRLHTLGLAGAAVLLGVDGMAHRQRRRARFFSRNEGVPLMIISIGSGETIGCALPALDDLLADPIVTLERIRVCKRDGARFAESRHLPEQDDAGLGVWQKLMVYAGEQARHGKLPLYVELIRRLREEGASGAASLRGMWGFSGDHPPHGDRLFHVGRQVPVVTAIVDTPDRIQRWFRIVDAVTDEAGLVTSEMVPAFHAIAPNKRVGGVRLLAHHRGGRRAIVRRLRGEAPAQPRFVRRWPLPTDVVPGGGG